MGLVDGEEVVLETAISSSSSSRTGEVEAVKP